MTVSSREEILEILRMPDGQARNFRVIDDRNISGPEHVFRLAEESGYAVDAGEELVK